MVDPAGRTVILRALQHHSLQDVDYGGREVADDDYQRIRSWGFTALRVAISWSRLEPRRGEVDEAALNEITEVVERARAAGLCSILEWHQDLYGRCATAPQNPLRSGANGAPDWACPAVMPSGLLPHWEMFDRFWANEDQVFDSWLATWRVVLSRFKDNPGVCGFEPMNEPQGFSTGGQSLERQKVYPAYRKFAALKREVGAGGLLVLDATVIRNETFELETEPLDDVDPDAVYAPHLYSGWILLYLVGKPTAPGDKVRDFNKAVAQAKSLRLPLWNGEWGVNLNIPSGLADLARHAALEDRHRIGSSYWAFERMGGQFTDGAQALLDASGQPRDGVLEVLARPYPMAVPGSLVAFSWAPERRTLQVEVEVSSVSAAPLVLFAPSRSLGECLQLTVDGPPEWEAREAPLEEVWVKLNQTGRFVIQVAACDQ